MRWPVWTWCGATCAASLFATVLALGEESPQAYYRRGEFAVAARRVQLRDTREADLNVEPGTEFAVAGRDGRRLLVWVRIPPEVGVFRYPRWVSGWIAQRDAVPGRAGKRWWMHLLSEDQRDLLTRRAVEALESKKYGIPLAAAAMLGHLNPRQAARPLSSLMQVGGSTLAGEAARSLGKLGPEGHGLLREALQHEQRHVPELAARALGVYGDEESCPALRLALRDADPRVQMAVREALLRLGDDAAIAALWRQGQNWAWNDKQMLDADLCDRAAEGLAMRGEAGIPLLREGLGHSHLFVVRSVIRTVGEFGYREFIPDLRKFKDAKIHDPVEYYREAVASLYMLGDEEALPILRQDLRSSDPERVARVVVWLARVRDVESIPTFRELLSNRWVKVRVAAAEALATLADRDSIPFWRSALGDSAQGVRAAAASALGKLGDTDSVSALEEILFHDPNDGPMRAAAEALAVLGTEGRAAVAKALKSESIRVRLAAVYALRRFDREEGVPAAAEALNDRWASVRTAAVESLGRLGGNDAVSLLMEACYDADETVSAAALHELLALGRRPGNSMKELVRVIAADEDVPVLQMIAAEAKPILLAMLNSDDGPRAKKAAKMLVRLGDKETVPELLAYMERAEDPTVTEWFANCTNLELSAAARTYARKKGYLIRSVTGEPPKVPWGR
ncbi:MAG: hypothetical protein GYA33_02420 [Thermogutta sp.]|nr:hypothetical protein [Thermogutta sp.]